MGAARPRSGRLLAGRLGWAYLDSDARSGLHRPHRGRDVRRRAARPRSGPRSPGCWPRHCPGRTRSWCRPPAGWCCPEPTGRCWPVGARWCGCGPTRRPWPAGWGRARAARCWTTTRPRAWSSSSGAPAAVRVRWPTWSSTSTSSRRPRVADRILLGHPVVLAAGIAEPGRPGVIVPVELGRRAPTRWWSATGSATSWPRGGRRRCPAARRAVVVTQEGIGVEVDPGLPFEVVTVPDGESAKSLAEVEDAVPALRPVRPEPGRRGGGRGRRGGHRPGRVRRRVVPAGHGLRERGHHAARPRSTRPSAGRPGSTSPRARTWWARSGSRGPCCATPRCWPPCRPGSGRRAGGRWPSTPSRDRRPALGRRLPARAVRSTSRWPAAWPSRPTVVAADEREGDRRMVLNYGHTLAHALEASAFDDQAASTCATARRWPSAWSSPPCWPGGSAGSTTAGSTHHRRVVGGFDLRLDLPDGHRPRRAGVVHGPGQEGPARPHLRARRTDGCRGGPGHRRGRRGRYPGGDGADHGGTADR